MSKKVTKAAATEKEQVNLAAFSEIAADRKLSEIDVMNSMPTLVPAQEGFLEGMTVAGEYQGTKRVYSDKFNNPKKDAEGREYRDLHVFRHHKAGLFGIWSVGILGFVMSRVPRNSYLAITYTGLGEAQKGKNAPHTFEFRGENLSIDTNSYLGDDEAETAAPAQAAATNDAIRP